MVTISGTVGVIAIIVTIIIIIILWIWIRKTKKAIKNIPENMDVIAILEKQKQKEVEDARKNREENPTRNRQAEIIERKSIVEPTSIRVDKADAVDRIPSKNTSGDGAVEETRSVQVQPNQEFARTRTEPKKKKFIPKRAESKFKRYT